MATQTMYKMKPIYNNSPIADALPKCMYKIKNFHENQADMMDHESAELQELLYRQEAVLKSLGKLKAEIYQIGSEIGVELDGYSHSKPKTSSSAPVSMKKPPTIVVHASPDDPPLSLFLLLKMAEHRGLASSMVTHIHSSLTMALPECLHDLFGTSNICETNTTICLRLIWKKDILAPCLIVSVADQSPILGEVSILRYLSRLLLPDLFSQVEPLQMANIDAWLNAAMKLTMSDNGIERKAFIQSLNCHLGKHKWLVNNAASLADIYCSIALIKTSDRGLFPNNVEKWISTCKKELPGFQDVKKM